MGTLTKAEPHLTRQALMARLKGVRGFRETQKWLVIWNAQVDPRPAREIALHTGLATQTVHNLVAAYNRGGPAALAGPGRGGRRKAYLTPAEEAALLKGFEKEALKGRVATAAQVQAALEKRLGHSVHKTTVYRLLARHGWSKRAPRPEHVASDKAEQAAFKKNSRKRLRKS